VNNIAYSQSKRDVTQHYDDARRQKLHSGTSWN